MSFMDFKDFPIFAVENETFSNEILQVKYSHTVHVYGFETVHVLDRGIVRNLITCTCTYLHLYIV